MRPLPAAAEDYVRRFVDSLGLGDRDAASVYREVARHLLRFVGQRYGRMELLERDAGGVDEGTLAEHVSASSRAARSNGGSAPRVDEDERARSPVIRYRSCAVNTGSAWLPLYAHC